MADAVRGFPITLTVQFNETIGGPLFDPDPDSLTLDILFGGVSVLDAPKTYTANEIVRTSLGHYEYTWTVPNDASLGEYEAVWAATINSAPVSGSDSFYVKEMGSVTPDSTGSDKLGEDYEINYVGELTPLFIDPDEITQIFPDIDPARALESIYYASLEVQGWIGVGNVPPSIAYEYIKAKVACELNQIYGLEGDEYSITLGDLSVTNRAGRSGVSAGTARTWCEIAAGLKRDLLQKVSPMRPVVRGAKHANPIPRRSIYKTNSNEVHMQGTLDDVDRPPSRF